MGRSQPWASAASWWATMVVLVMEVVDQLLALPFSFLLVDSKFRVAMLDNKTLPP